MSSPVGSSPYLLVSASEANPSVFPSLHSGLGFPQGADTTVLFASVDRSPYLSGPELSLLIQFMRTYYLTFSSLEIQFIKPKSKMRGCQICRFTADERRQAERPCLWTAGPCLVPSLSCRTNFTTSERDPPAIRLRCHSTQGSVCSGPSISAWWCFSKTIHVITIHSVVYNSEVANSTTCNGQISCYQNALPEDYNYKFWTKYKKQLPEGTKEEPKEGTFCKVSEETICSRPYVSLHFLAGYAKNARP